MAQWTWQEFERRVGGMFEVEGYTVEHTGTAGTGQRFDGGVDLVLRRGSEVVLVQCKHWNAAQVPHNDVHQLIGVVETRQATAGILVTSGEFTVAARDAASKARRVSLIDGSDLRRRLGMAAAAGHRLPLQASPAWASVADKALDAAMFVATRGRWSGRGGRRRSVGDELRLLGIKLLFGIVLAGAMLAFVSHQVGKMKDGVAEIGRSAPTAAPPVSRSAPPAAHPGSARPEAPVVAAPPMTPEQLEEEKRKNAEAMEILERTTPSVYD